MIAIIDTVLCQNGIHDVSLFEFQKIPLEYTNEYVNRGL